MRKNDLVFNKQDRHDRLANVDRRTIKMFTWSTLELQEWKIEGSFYKLKNGQR